MNTTVATAMTNEPLFQARQRIKTKRLRALPVVDREGRLAGLLTAEDVNEAYRLLLASPEPTRPETSQNRAGDLNRDERRPVAVG